jgi:hypothetical protein
MFVVQHPYGADTLHSDTSAAWQPLLDQHPLGKTPLLALDNKSHCMTPRTSQKLLRVTGIVIGQVIH